MSNENKDKATDNQKKIDPKLVEEIKDIKKKAIANNTIIRK